MTYPIFSPTSSPIADYYASLKEKILVSLNFLYVLELKLI
jgi:hypothetical protein